MKNNKVLTEKLSLTLKNLEALTLQLRATQDYSEKSEIIFLLKELVTEQMDGKSQDNENSSHTNNASR